MPEQTVPMARYRVEHETEYHYASAADNAWQLARLSPRDTPWQRVLGHRIDIDPAPEERAEHVDGFGNHVTRFALVSAHQQLVVRARSEVEVVAHIPAVDAPSPAWEEAVQAYLHGGPELRYELAPFAIASPLVPMLPDAQAFARTEFGPGRPWLQAVFGLVRRIYEKFDFDPQATTVSTPMADVLRDRRGVCQDFAHLLVGCLRSVGVPARYVSGYLLTTPPPGKPRLVGADASHAWVSAWCPGLGWVDCDPTNGKLADTEFVTVGWGRDYWDVAPLRGVVRGGGAQTLEVRVTVAPLETVPGSEAPSDD